MMLLKQQRKIKSELRHRDIGYLHSGTAYYKGYSKMSSSKLEYLDNKIGQVKGYLNKYH